MAHKEVDHVSRDVATVAFDYLFVTKKDVFTKGEWPRWPTRAEVEENALKVLVVRDLKSRSCFAHAVPQKGIDESGFVVNCIVEYIAWLGYSRVILKSDNEPAFFRS